MLFKQKKMSAMLTAMLLLLCSCGTANTPSPPPQTTTTSTLSTTTTITTTATQTTTTRTTTVPSGPAADCETILKNMSLEQKVGQLFLAHCPTANAVQTVRQYHPGGYLLFGGHFKNQTPQSITRALASYQQASDVPMFIAVDEEGGRITRVSRFSQFRSEPFASPRDLFAAGGLSAVLQTEREKISLLSSLGINVNLAPVCDITTDPSGFMYDRSLGQDAQTTAQVISAMVQLSASKKMGAAVKHFPGYGNNSDTHSGIAEDLRSLEQLQQNDLIPFAAAVNTGCDAIMVSHTIVHALDPTTPASLSAQAVQYIRETMGFDGVIVTDDLAMRGVTDLYGEQEAAVLAVLAGCDVLCSGAFAQQYPAVLQAVQSGRISEQRIDRSVLRILQWKRDLGLL